MIRPLRSSTLRIVPRVSPTTISLPAWVTAIDISESSPMVTDMTGRRLTRES